MDAKVKAKWVAALRSGEYKQGRDYLERDGKFCCLGVLCKVMNEPILCGQTTLSKSFADEVGVSVSGNLPTCVQIGKEHYSHLIGLNDQARFTFSEIADIIEEQL